MRRTIGGCGGVIALVLAASALLPAVLSGCSTTIDDPQPASAQERAAFLGHYLDASWTQSELQGRVERPAFPDAEPVSLSRWWEVVGRCLEAQGIDESESLVLTDGGAALTRDDGERVAEADALAGYTCAAQHPMSPDSIWEYLSESQARYLWQYWNAYTLPCLRLHSATPDDVPSEEAFVAAGRLTWQPYISIIDGQATVSDYQRAYDVLVARCGPEFGELQDEAFGF